jgi:hypothetical protein
LWRSWSLRTACFFPCPATSRGRSSACVDSSAAVPKGRSAFWRIERGETRFPA